MEDKTSHAIGGGSATPAIDNAIIIEDRISYRQHAEYSWLFLEEQYRNTKGELEPSGRCNNESFKERFRYKNWPVILAIANVIIQCLKEIGLDFRRCVSHGEFFP